MPLKSIDTLQGKKEKSSKIATHQNDSRVCEVSINHNENEITTSSDNTKDILKNSSIPEVIVNQNNCTVYLDNEDRCKRDFHTVTISVNENSTNITGRAKSRNSSCELDSLPLTELRLLADNLARTAKDVSEELVQLLQENDMLKQESDARNIAIEQLLKLTVQQAENELRPIQMSVVNLSIGDENWD